MNTIDDLLPFVVPEVPGAPEAIVKMRLREALRQFCRETEAWLEEIDMDSVADQAEYDLVPSYDAYTLRIISVKTRTTSTASFDSIDPVDASRYKLNTNGLAYTFYSGYEPQTDLTDGIRVKVALMPNTSAEEFSGVLLDRYAEGLYSLAKHFLMRTPQTSYFNPDLARFYKVEYDGVRACARKEIWSEHKDTNVQIQQLGNQL